MNPWPVDAEVEEVHLPRPGHADLVGMQKYGHPRRPQRARAGQRPRDRGAGRRRARSPAAFLARARRQRPQPRDPDRLRAGARARTTWSPADFEGVDEDPVRCLDADAERGDGRGDQPPAQGQREPRRQLRGARLRPRARASAPTSPGRSASTAGSRRRVASIQSIKGVAIGEAWEVAGRPGSEAHDEIFHSPERGYFRETNHAGGLEGGMTNGEPLLVRAAIKPISTLTKPLALGRHRDQGAGAGAARAHRLDRRPRRRGRRRGDGLPDPRPLLPGEVRRRPHRRRPRRQSTPTSSASTGVS